MNAKASAAQATDLVSNTYDQTPYTSFPFPQTHPDLLRSIAFLFGLNAPSPEKARILELGCAAGGNIMAIAARYPNSECVGIDYSARQIEEGNAILKETGLKNLSLRTASILDIDKSWGTFDYIICHGVFSWVPKEVQEKIIQISAENLSKDGVAYISFNTLPGWNMVRTMRDMMLFHTQRFTTPEEKATQARLMLKFMGESVGKVSAYAQFIEQERAILENQADAYLLHEHLEENNIQYYFHEFMSMAQNQQLQYVADANISLMFAHNFPKEVADILLTSDDFLRTEQYIDFLTNRRFRSTLLCHADRVLRRNLSPQIMEDTLVSLTLSVPESLANWDYKAPTVIKFDAKSGLSIESAEPIVIAMVQALANAGNQPMHVRKLTKAVQEILRRHDMLPRELTEELLFSTICNHALRNLLAGAMHLHLEQAAWTLEVAKKPVAFSMARAQAKQGQAWVANLRQEVVGLAPFDLALIQLLDGKHDQAALLTALLPKFSDGTLHIEKEGEKLSDEGSIRSILPDAIAQRLTALAKMALLEEK